MKEQFRRFATASASASGSPVAFLLAVLLVAGWLLSGPLFGFSDTWQLVINTTTTIITFLMVFLIQYAQNRESKALHLKVDEMLRAIPEARTELARLNKASDKRLREVEAELEQ